MDLVVGRTRQTVGENTYQVLHPVMLLQRIDVCVNPNSVTTYTPIPFEVLTNKNSSVIVDETLNLSILSYEERFAYLQSQAYQDYKLTFKNCFNVQKAYSMEITGPFISYEDKSWYTDDACQRYTFAGDLFTTYLDWYHSGLYPLDPVAAFKTRSQFLDPIVFNDLRKYELIELLTSDHKLIGSETFSVANFIYEIKEVLSLTSIFKLKTNNFAKEGSDRWLAFNFGIKPLIDDIKAIYDILANLNMRINRWNEMCETSETLNVHAKLSEDLQEVNFTSYGGPYNNIKNEITGTFYHKIVGHTYFKPQPISDIDQMKLHLSLTGLNNPLSVIWEAIPYSFLVDWVYGVSDMIEAYEASEPVIKTSSQTFGYSVKYDLVLQNRASFANDQLPHVTAYTTLDTPPGSYTEMCNITEVETSFDRQLVDLLLEGNINPVDVAEFKPSLDGKQISLIAALAIQAL